MPGKVCAAACLSLGFPDTNQSAVRVRKLISRCFDERTRQELRSQRPLQSESILPTCLSSLVHLDSQLRILSVACRVLAGPWSFKCDRQLPTSLMDKFRGQYLF